MAWPLANNQIAWRCRADLASGAARNRPARSSRLRCAATCTMLVSHEPWRVNLPAASPRATPAERIIRKPYDSGGSRHFWIRFGARMPGLDVDKTQQLNPGRM
jgi:hypothetical protein